MVWDVLQFYYKDRFLPLQESCSTSTAELQSRMNFILINVENLSFLSYMDNIVKSL